jgi:excisionase family DNA binding protein
MSSNKLPFSLRKLEQEKLLTPAEVANLYRVDPKTVMRWAKSGVMPCVRTPGGHRRFRVADVRTAWEAGGGQWPTDS